MKFKLTTKQCIYEFDQKNHLKRLIKLTKKVLQLLTIWLLIEKQTKEIHKIFFLLVVSTKW